MDLSIVVPTFNEEECIAECIREIYNFFPKETEVVIVNDGSTDKTDEIILNYKKTYPIKYIFYKNNKGYSHAIREGIKVTTKKYVTYIDADLQYHPSEVIKLYNHALKNNSDFVIGEPKNKYYNIIRKNVSNIYNFYIRLLFNLDLKDANSVKIMNKKLLDNINLSLDYGMIELETLIGFHRQGARIEKHPIEVRERFAGKSKCSTKIAYRTLIDIIKLYTKKNLIKK